MIKGKISEIFESIQGEGLFVGERHLFVRFYGCNLTCKFCDTHLTYFEEYEPSRLLEIVAQRRNGSSCVVFTGGEPLLQTDFLKEVVGRTKEAGFKNYLETNGSMPEALEEVIEYMDIVAMDLKLPTSTGMPGFLKAHTRFLEIAMRKDCFLKAVICLSTEESDINEMIRLFHENRIHATVVLQPNSQELSIRLLKKIDQFKARLIEANIATCMIPQLHKIIGAP
ncbi:MAG: 7-carboxy-7-deazaguanine synthase QueE [Candidatus Omnitrophota bacterium]|jgi:organic radical activating enzyme|nr:MAG: 7-carboxy-7-deazaguanine synthase QueE [Candidatus Omnitrophota bacterium]